MSDLAIWYKSRRCDVGQNFSEIERQLFASVALTRLTALPVANSVHAGATTIQCEMAEVLSFRFGPSVR